VRNKLRVPVKTALFALLLVALSLRAQAPTPVDMSAEPHHRVVLANSYVRALRFSLPAGDSTLLHAHNVPYVSVSLGAADFANDVAGKPEVRGKTVDGQVGYSRGGFAHLVKADAGVPFNNLTIELLHPQGEPRNLCDKIVPGDLGTCDVSGDAASAAIATRPLFETDEIRVFRVVVRKGDVTDKPRTQPGLLLAVSGAAIKVAHVPGASTRTLHAGEIIWLPVGAKPKFTVADGPEARLVLISFKDAAGAAH
jgi:quercetin dioxygenase-like cupin family protein